MQVEHTLLAVGEFKRSHRAGLALAASEAQLDLEIATSAADAFRCLDDRVPHGLLVDPASPAASELCLSIRGDARLAQIPILTLNHRLDDLAFADVFSWGGDDALELGSTWSLVRRLRALPRTPGTTTEGSSGSVLVADSDRTRRLMLGRVLRNAGYTITFAASGEDAQEFSQDKAVDLVVESADIESNLGQIVRSARAAGNDAIWIFTCAPKDLAQVRRALSDVERTAVTDGFAPPENVLFLANELRRGQAQDNRASARLLYGTTVAFRSAGLGRDDHGYCYNISRAGLYVRTLSPPESNHVWLEMQPPRSERRVRLEGTVRWHRPFGPSGHATVPPGFGVEISDGSSRDMQAWGEGYQAFAAAFP